MLVLPGLPQDHLPVAEDHASRVWRRKELGDATMAGPALAEVEAAASRAWSAQASEGFAVFTRHESEGRLHCALQVYFSPRAAGLARDLGAVVCPRPAPEGLTLLVGDPAVLVELATSGSGLP